MPAIPGASRPSCNVASRRDFLRVGSLAALGATATLPGLARAGSVAAGPRPEVSCILVWLQGGISHLDSFDPKPDAPSGVRGEFAAIPTRVPGISLCEHLPKLAAHQDKFSIVCSLDPRNGSHGMADASMMSGHPLDPSLAFPSYGSVVSRVRGGRSGMPPYVQIGESIDGRFGGGRAGFLGEQDDPFILPVGPPPAAGPRRDRSDARIASPRAVSALDLSKEDPRVRDRYGRHSLGRGCLMASRLLDAGVRFVTVTDGGWDTHRDNFGAMRGRLLPRLDSALSGLLQDLHERGRLETTLVMVLSDFGRTPKVNSSAGRDHSSTSGVALLAGAGLKGGVAVGRTDAIGAAPVESPYAPEDLAATFYDRLGIPAGTTLATPDGRPVRINYGGRPIRELL